MTSTDLYLDQIRTDILDHLDPSYFEVLFSRSDYYSRSRKTAHPDVRTCLRETYEDAPEYRYLLSSAEIVRERLAIQGYTADRMSRAWSEARDMRVEFLKKLVGSIGGSIATEAAVLAKISYAEWQQALAARERARFEGGPFPHEGFDLEGVFSQEPLFDVFAALAVRLDALKPTSVWVDLTELYDAYEFDPSATFHENLERSAEPFEADGGKIIILTEGTTDQRIISAAMRAFYPEFADAYQFIDFEAFRIEGGASPLARMVKSFASVRMQSRMLAIFDNDAAGAEALMSLRKITLPPNLRAMCLPDLAMARSYPTEGPEGLRLMDVNGRACSIEMFLGRSSLATKGGKFRPVRWSQWNKAAGRYQGELDDKFDVMKRFLSDLNQTPRKLRCRYPDMCDLLGSIFGAFKS